MKKHKKVGKSRITNRILAWFLMVSIFPLICIGFISYRNSDITLKENAMTAMKAFSESHIRLYNAYAENEYREIRSQSRNQMVTTALEDFMAIYHIDELNSSEYKKVKDEYKSFFSNYVESNGYYDVFLIGMDGDIVFTAAEERDLGTNLFNGPYKDTELARVFKNAVKLVETEISDFRIYSPSNEPAAFIAAPVFKDGRIIGVLAFQINNNEMYKLGGDYTGLGKTGESVVATIEGDSAMVISPLRHDADAAFKRKIKIGDEKGVPIQKSSQGYSGNGIYLDYRGKEVLAVWSYLPHYRAGIVVKIDCDEVFAPIRVLKNMTVYLTLITVVLVIFIAYYISISISAPIIELNRTALEIADGDLSVISKVSSNDELGELSASINTMTESLKMTADQAKKVSLGNFTEKIVPKSEKDVLGKTLLEMTSSLQLISEAAGEIASGNLNVEVLEKSESDFLSKSINKMASSLRSKDEESQSDIWLKNGVSRLNDVMRGEKNISDLSLNVITEIANYLGVEIGAFYVADNIDGKVVFSLSGSYAYSNRKNLSNKFGIGEGVIGQAAQEKKRITISNVPDDYVKITSGLGETSPKFITVIPILYNDMVVGVIEVGYIREFDNLEIKYLDEAIDTIGILIETVRSRENLEVALLQSRQLSEELQTRQEELSASNEELEQQQVELRAANEELEEQTQLLKQSEEKLKAQQEELGASNEELEEKNQALQIQKKSVEVARKEIEVKAEELALASKYKSEFLANMSHELRTPLNSLLLLSRMLFENKEKNLNEDQVTSAKIIYNSGNDLLSLINEILDLSKIEAGRMDLQVESVKTKEIAESMGKNFKHLADEKGIGFDVVIQDDIPVSIETDMKRVVQILKNLVSNAVKFTEKGGVTVVFGRPDSGKGPAGAYLKVCVKDTGIGIQKNKQKIIFEAFQQADGGTARKYGGTGLGLSISRELARILSGEIHISSEYGIGSEFTLYLPASANKGVSKLTTGAQQLEAVAIREETKMQWETSGFNGIPDDRDGISEGDKIILVIEDDDNFAKLLMMQCHEKGFRCIAAATGEEGLELAERFRPAAIILDIKLPGIDGWTVLDALKGNPSIRHIPIHIMSVDDTDMDAYKKGAVGYLMKPAKKEDLDEAFRKLEGIFNSQARNLLVVEDDEGLRKSIVKLIGNGDVHTDEVSTGAESISAVINGMYDCIILDLGLPDMSGFEVLKKLEATEGVTIPPVIIYTGRELTREEDEELHRFSKSIIIKGVRSEERLLDETALFLHRMIDKMPEKKRKMIASLHDVDQMVKGKKVLIVDDDMRNVFAMSRILQDKGMNVLKAEDGKKALDILASNPDTDIVLMDIMMPVMDGYETMRIIRTMERFRKLPIIALTAKAMKEDRERCIEAGASDYMAKPLDMNRLSSMMRVWLYK